MQPPKQPQQPWPQCHSPIFNYIEKLRLDESNHGGSLDDDLEDINNLIDTEVGVENLRQNEFDNSQLMAQFQQQPSNRIKVRIGYFHILTASSIKDNYL